MTWFLDRTTRTKLAIGFGLRAALSLSDLGQRLKQMVQRYTLVSGGMA